MSADQNAVPPPAEAAERRPTLLVVDDAPQNLSLMSDILEQDYSVKLAPSGLFGRHMREPDGLAAMLGH